MKPAFFERWRSPAKGSHFGSVYGVAFSPDGKTIASASDDKTIRLWSKKGQHIATLKGHSNSVYSVAFSPDGKTIASASRDNTVRLWDFTLFQLFVTKEAKSTPLFDMFSDGAMFFWDVELDGLEFKKRTPNPIRDKKFLPLLNPPRDGQSKYDQSAERGERSF